MLYREIIAVCFQIHTKHINTLFGQNLELYIKTQSVPRSKIHSVSVTKTSQLMLCREIIAVCSQIHTKNTNALCGQNLEFLHVKPVGTYSNHWTLKGPDPHRYNWPCFLTTHSRLSVHSHPGRSGASHRHIAAAVCGIASARRRCTVSVAYTLVFWISNICTRVPLQGLLRKGEGYGFIWRKNCLKNGPSFALKPWYCH